MTRTHVWHAEQRRCVPGRAATVSGERPPRDAAHSEERVRPADTQVWNWVESVVLSGYGPSASSFL
ncbi:hypothetical protein [Streptomyces sp. NPDC052107]|uniref:hypothetical protein n=1 Tax=Streptomyces sp. NPDC052107 TaxID=3155632 RepID=UPI00341AB717